MTERFGTLADMIDYAKDSNSKDVRSRSKANAKQKIHKTKAKIPAKKKTHERVLLQPMKVSSPTSRKSILKFIKEVHG